MRRKSIRRALSRLAWLLLGLGGILPQALGQAGTTNYLVRGVVTKVNKSQQQVVIAHEPIPDFMDAMTMPFAVKDAAILTHVAPGENITFQLHVAETESWIDQIESHERFPAASTHPAVLLKNDSPVESPSNPPATGHPKNPLRYYKFTNELGQAVSLSDFQGQALALTFFFSRCPIPEFCPRLSRNFEEVQKKLEALENAPTNWHLLSVTFDPAHDTPQVLKAYGATYRYDPAHWSFLTGPKDKIAELARLCDVRFDPDSGLFNHNFRTLIIDASNHLQMVFPTSGNISELIVQELLKATGGTNRLSEYENREVVIKK